MCLCVQCVRVCLYVRVCEWCVRVCLYVRVCEWCVCVCLYVRVCEWCVCVCMLSTASLGEEIKKMQCFAAIPPTQCSTNKHTYILAHIHTQTYKQHTLTHAHIQMHTHIYCSHTYTVACKHTHKHTQTHMLMNKLKSCTFHHASPHP